MSGTCNITLLERRSNAEAERYAHKHEAAPLMTKRTSELASLHVQAPCWRTGVIHTMPVTPSPKSSTRVLVLHQSARGRPAFNRSKRASPAVAAPVFAFAPRINVTTRAHVGVVAVRRVVHVFASGDVCHSTLPFVSTI